MCLIIFSSEKSKTQGLILAANRDEFFSRPTLEANFWPDYPMIIGGVDLQGGGSWLAMDKTGRWAAVTNYREGEGPHADQISRGLLVKNFLINKYSPKHYSNLIQKNKGKYGGFNLLLGSPTEVVYTSNRRQGIITIKDGVNGLSNHNLNTAWPKLTEGCDEFRYIIKQKSLSMTDDLFKLLANRQKAPIDELPDTGISKQQERMLSSRFVESNGEYGTRTSTVILISDNNSVFFEERNFNNKSIEAGRKQIQFDLTYN